MNRHLLRTVLCTLVTLCLFASCRKDGSHPKNYPVGCPDLYNHNYAGDVIDAMAPGIYVFRTMEEGGDTCLLAKSTDGGVFYLDDIHNLGGNFIGNVIYYHFYGTDNVNSAYSFYGEKFNDGSRRYYYKQDEFLDRTAMFRGIKNITGISETDVENFAKKIADKVYEIPMALCRFAPKNDTFLDKWNPTSDTVVCGIPVTCYSKDGEYYYVDENWMCLYFFNYHAYSSVTGHEEHELVRFEEAGTFEETYHKIYDMYGYSQPAPTMQDCIETYRKQANEWLTDKYPRSIDGMFDKYTGQGTIHDMEIGRRAKWSADYDIVCAINVKIENASYDDVVAYKELTKGHCNDISDDECNPTEGTVFFRGSFEEPETSGDFYFHPAYEVTLRKDGVLEIEFDIVKVIFVKDDQQ